MQCFLGIIVGRGEPKHFAANLLCGLSHFCRSSVYGHLRGSWKLYDAWKRKELPARAHPLLPDQVIAIAAWFIRDRRMPQMGLVLLLGFHCVLRTIEMLHLKASDIVLGDTGNAAVLQFDSKSGNRLGFTERRTVTDVTLVRLAAAIKSTMQPGDFLITTSGSQFRADFSSGIRFLGLSVADYKPYSIRRGGTTADFRSHGDIKSHPTQRGLGRPADMQDLHFRIFGSLGGALDGGPREDRCDG